MLSTVARRLLAKDFEASKRQHHQHHQQPQPQPQPQSHYEILSREDVEARLQLLQKDMHQLKSRIQQRLAQLERETAAVGPTRPYRASTPAPRAVLPSHVRSRRQMPNQTTTSPQKQRDRYGQRLGVVAAPRREQQTRIPTQPRSQPQSPPRKEQTRTGQRQVPNRTARRYPVYGTGTGPETRARRQVRYSADDGAAGALSAFVAGV